MSSILLWDMDNVAQKNTEAKGGYIAETMGGSFTQSGGI